MFGARLPALRQPPPSRRSTQGRASGVALRRRAMAAGAAGALRLAVVGDVHEQWGPDDEAALAYLGADVAVFVGDFGNENVRLVQRIAAVRHPPTKAVCLGNHDAWFSLTKRGRERYARLLARSSALPPPALGGAAAAPQGSAGGADGTASSSSNVARQLAALGDDHVGYAARRLPGDPAVWLVGGRPFSKGGAGWSDSAEFYEAHYGVASMEGSAAKIADTALGAVPAHGTVVVVSHSGPAGLGARRSDPCGVDWLPGEGDHGDPDLQAAVAAMQAAGRRVPLVLFGHMHGALKGGGQRDMVAYDAARGTLYLNAAVVPRWRRFPLEAAAPGRAAAAQVGPAGGASGQPGPGQSAGEAQVQGHHFCVVELDRETRSVRSAADIWLAALPAAAAPGGERCWSVLAERPLARLVDGAGGAPPVLKWYRGSVERWESAPAVAAAAHVQL